MSAPIAQSLAAVGLMLMLGCSSSGGDGRAMPAVAPELAAAVEPAPTPTAPQAPPGITVAQLPPLSPFTPELVANLRRIRARSDRRQDDVFMKVGDSSTVSRGFLECFARPDRVDLGSHDSLAETAAVFRRRRASGHDSYRRISLAAREGWSARQVLSGHPPPVLAELHAVRPRFAFVMNGGNDVEGHDDYRYAQRMLRIVELLEEHGVIPILNSIPPRADNADMNRWVDRYNQISWAIARARRLPYLDYHQVMMALPRLGLAGDGVHPNIYVHDNRGRACILTDEGLAYGHNARNLLALRGLDLLRRTVIEEEEAPAPSAAPAEGEGTVESPFEVTSLPFADLRDTRTEGSDAIDTYRCGAQDESGREIVYRLRVDAPVTVRLLAVGRSDVDVDIHLLEGEPDGQACRARGDRQIETTLQPGVWCISVDTFSDAGAAAAGEALILFAPMDAPSSTPP